MSACLTLYRWLDGAELARHGSADAFLAAMFRDRIGRYCVDQGVMPDAALRTKRERTRPGEWIVALRVPCRPGAFDPAALAAAISPDTLPELCSLEMP